MIPGYSLEPSGAVLQVTGDPRLSVRASWSSAAGDAAQFSARLGMDEQMCIGIFRHLLFVVILRFRETIGN